MIRAYFVLIGRLKSRRIRPKKHILNNKASNGFKQAIGENGINYDLVPLDMHRRNIVAKAIQIFKDHLVAIPGGIHDSFPIHLWY